MWRGHFSAILNCLNNERIDVASYKVAYDAEVNVLLSETLKLTGVLLTLRMVNLTAWTM